MAQLESIAMWATVFAYAAASVAFVLAFAFGRERFERVALWCLVAGLTAHAVGLISRWVVTGRVPILGFYEVASVMAFITVGMLAWLVWRYPGFLPAGIVVMPFALLLVGGSMLASKDADSVSGSLSSLWLVIHVLFSNLAYGCYVVAFILAVGYLLRDYSRDGGRVAPLLSRLPEQAVIDDLTYRFVGAGFIFEGIMIASGAIWANEAWGRYWAWDPIETWSLIAWGIYALYLHLTLTLGWRGRKAAWVLVIALPVIVFSLLGVPIVYSSIHAAYLAL